MVLEQQQQLITLSQVPLQQLVSLFQVKQMLRL